MARSYLLYGPAGTWKSSFPLVDATPDHRISFNELEAGGFDRAARRLQIPEGAVKLNRFKRPFDGLEQIGAIIKTGSGNVMPQLRYELDGWVDMFSEFSRTFMADVQAGYTPVTDTVTRCWLMLRQFYNELVQKATGGNADNLGQMKFTAPNDIMLQLLEYPKAYGQDSIWIAHEERVFGSDPPVYQADTMKEVPNNVDVTLRFKLVQNQGVATMMKGGEVGQLVGLEIPSPTLRGINAILDLVSTLEAEGESWEKDAEWLLASAKLRGLY